MKYIYPLLAFVFMSCSIDKTEKTEATPDSKTEKMNPILWELNITLNDSITLPVKMTSQPNGELNFTIHNAEEKISLKNIRRSGDSIYMEMPVFQTGFEGVLKDNEMYGELVKYDAENYRLPFYAHKVIGKEMELEAPCCSIERHYKTTFRPNQENKTEAIGEFKQDGNKVSGTFMTETGDYRYLSGTLEGNKLMLSAFDGNHLYVFKATVEDNGEMEGMFFSGKTRADRWIAQEDPSFELADPEELTYLKEGETELAFAFPTTSDEIIEYSKDNFKGKVVILQILGSWCPNCMDESRFLQDMYSKYHQNGLEIIGLAFERRNDKSKAYPAINKMTTDLNLTYPIVFAGSTRVSDREKALPQLNKIMSFPTSIYLDKDGEVVKIHTGFSGPGTSEYDTFVEETESLLKELLQE